jgi:hypothetical protein
LSETGETTQELKQMRRTTTAFALLLALSFPVDSNAQAVLDSLEGRRVRLTLEGLPSAIQEGILHRADSLSLTLRTPRGPIAVYPKNQILRLEVAIGSNRRRRVLQGLGIGAVLGIAGYKLWADHHYVDDEFNAALAVEIGMPVGALLGAMIGAALADDQWLPVVGLGTANGSNLQMDVRFQVSPWP